MSLSIVHGTAGPDGCVTPNMLGKEVDMANKDTVYNNLYWSLQQLTTRQYNSINHAGSRWNWEEYVQVGIRGIVLTKTVGVKLYTNVYERPPFQERFPSTGVVDQLLDGIMQSS